MSTSIITIMLQIMFILTPCFQYSQFIPRIPKKKLPDQFPFTKCIIRALMSEYWLSQKCWMLNQIIDQDDEQPTSSIQYMHLNIDTCTFVR